MKKLLFLIFSFSLAIVFILILNEESGNQGLEKYQKAPKKASKIEGDYRTTFVPFYSSGPGEFDLEKIQCPIPLEDRVKNHTGIQCVYSSIETLGRWAEEPKLTNPPITSRAECKGYSSPRRAEEILNKLNVKFEQTYGSKEKGISLIKKAMKEGRGVLWDVPGHAMVLVHYSETENKVCWVDNSDRALRVQQTTISKFNQRWQSWVLVIYADKEVVKYKIYKNINFPILDHKSKKNFPFDFIPLPELN